MKKQPLSVIAEQRRRARTIDYDPQPLVQRLREILKSRNQTYREASLEAGLDHQAVRRILDGHRPQMHICILFADHFGINPNEFLELAGWPHLKAFDIHTTRVENLPPEAVQLAIALAGIPDPGRRKQIAEAMLEIIQNTKGVV